MVQRNTRGKNRRLKIWKSLGSRRAEFSKTRIEAYLLKRTLSPKHAQVMVHVIQKKHKEIIFGITNLKLFSFNYKYNLKSIKTIQKQPKNQPNKWQHFISCQNEINNLELELEFVKCQLLPAKGKQGYYILNTKFFLVGGCFIISFHALPIFFFCWLIIIG